MFNIKLLCSFLFLTTLNTGEKQKHLSCALVSATIMQGCATLLLEKPTDHFCTVHIPFSEKTIPIQRRYVGYGMVALSSYIIGQYKESFNPIYEILFLLGMTSSIHICHGFYNRRNDPQYQINLSTPIWDTAILFFPTSCQYDSALKRFLRLHRDAILEYKLKV